MDKFNDSGKIDMPVAPVGKHTGTEQNQSRPKALAATVDDIVAELVDQSDPGMQPFLYKRIDRSISSVIRWRTFSKSCSGFMAGVADISNRS